MRKQYGEQAVRDFFAGNYQAINGEALRKMSAEYNNAVKKAGTNPLNAEYIAVHNEFTARKEEAAGLGYHVGKTAREEITNIAQSSIDLGANQSDLINAIETKIASSLKEQFTAEIKVEVEAQNPGVTAEELKKLVDSAATKKAEKHIEDQKKIPDSGINKQIFEDIKHKIRDVFSLEDEQLKYISLGRNTRGDIVSDMLKNINENSSITTLQEQARVAALIRQRSNGFPPRGSKETAAFQQGAQKGFALFDQVSRIQTGKADKLQAEAISRGTSPLIQAELMKDTDI